MSRGGAPGATGRAAARMAAAAAAACVVGLLGTAGLVAPAEAGAYKVRVLSITGSHEIIVRVEVPRDGEVQVAETAFRVNEVHPRGAYAPARARSDVTDSPVQGMHVNSFDVDIVDGDGKSTRSERMTAVLNFDEHAVVTFFAGTVTDAEGTKVLRCLLWGYPPGVQREL